MHIFLVAVVDAPASFIASWIRVYFIIYINNWVCRKNWFSLQLIFKLVGLSLYFEYCAYNIILIVFKQYYLNKMWWLFVYFRFSYIVILNLKMKLFDGMSRPSCVLIISVICVLFQNTAAKEKLGNYMKLWSEFKYI